MALKKIKETEEELEIKVDNGDLAALKRIQEFFKFKDKESILRFALAIVAKAAESDKNKIILNANGVVSTIEPRYSLLEKSNNEEIKVEQLLEDKENKEEDLQSPPTL